MLHQSPDQKIIFDINFTDFKNELFLYKDTKVSSFIYPCTNSPINKYAFHAAIFGKKTCYVSIKKKTTTSGGM